MTFNYPILCGLDGYKDLFRKEPEDGFKEFTDPSKDALLMTIPGHGVQLYWLSRGTQTADNHFPAQSIVVFGILTPPSRPAVRLSHCY